MARKSYDDLETDYFDEEVGGSFLSLMSLVVAFLAVAAFIALAWYAYQDDSDDSGELETIYAEEGDFRVEPEGESGWQFPDAERQVYNLGNGDVDDMKVEQILPKPERPAPREKTQPEAEGWINNAATQAEEKAEEGEIGLTDAERRKLEEIANAPVQEAPEVVVKAKEEVVEAIVEPVKIKPEPAPAVEKSQPTTATLTANRLQLGAFGSNSEARKSWEKIQGKNNSLLGNKKAHVEEADVKGKTYYRVQVYPFDSKAQADALCVMLKSNNQPCFSVKR